MYDLEYHQSYSLTFSTCEGVNVAVLYCILEPRPGNQVVPDTVRACHAHAVPGTARRQMAVCRASGTSWCREH